MSTEIITKQNAITQQKPVGIPELLTGMREIARVFHSSGLFTDTKSEAQFIVKIIAGRELGLSEFVAVRDLCIIQGKIAMGASQIGARIQEAGGYWTATTWTDEVCVLEFSRNGKVLTPRIDFTINHARKLQLAERDNYKKQPRTMLFHRALTLGARMFFPQVFNGPIYTPDELRNGEVEEEGGRPEPVTVTINTVGPVVEPVVLPDAAGQPWMAFVEGPADPKLRGKHLADLPTKWLEAALTPAKASKFTLQDRANIIAALATPENKPKAIQLLAEMAQMAAEVNAKQAPLTFEQDDVPGEYDLDMTKVREGA